MGRLSVKAWLVAAIVLVVFLLYPIPLEAPYPKMKVTEADPPTGITPELREPKAESQEKATTDQGQGPSSTTIILLILTAGMIIIAMVYVLMRYWHRKTPPEEESIAGTDIARSKNEERGEIVYEEDLEEEQIEETDEIVTETIAGVEIEIETESEDVCWEEIRQRLKTDAENGAVIEPEVVTGEDIEALERALMTDLEEKDE